MRAILLMTLWLLAIHGLAAEKQTLTATDTAKNSVTLHQEPCTEVVVLQHIEKQFRARFERAVLIYQGKQYKACWTAGIDGHVYVVDEVGEVSKVPMSVFIANPPALRI